MKKISIEHRALIRRIRDLDFSDEEVKALVKMFYFILTLIEERQNGKPKGDI